MKAETGQHAKILRSDGGGEFCNNNLRDWLETNGITHQVTPPYTPQLNGVAERTMRTVVESARSQLHGKKVPLELWGLAVLSSAYVQNRTVSSTSNVTPFELWHGKKPDISHLKVFGCPAFAHVPDEKRRKLDSKATIGMMAGYCELSNAYKIWEPMEKKLIISRDVIFEEESVCGKPATAEAREYHLLFPPFNERLVIVNNCLLPKPSIISSSILLVPTQSTGGSSCRSRSDRSRSQRS